jgi:hypothetical protein
MGRLQSRKHVAAGKHITPYIKVCQHHAGCKTPAYQKDIHMVNIAQQF